MQLAQSLVSPLVQAEVANYLRSHTNCVNLFAKRNLFQIYNAKRIRDGTEGKRLFLRFNHDLCENRFSIHSGERENSIDIATHLRHSRPNGVRNNSVAVTDHLGCAL
jgi:hypothetical protein